MSNIAPAHSFYGDSASAATTLAPIGSQPAGAGVDYVGHTRCRANDDTCQGPRAKGTDFCVGHLRSMGLLTKKGDDEQG